MHDEMKVWHTVAGSTDLKHERDAQNGLPNAEMPVRRFASDVCRISDTRLGRSKHDYESILRVKADSKKIDEFA